MPFDDLLFRDPFLFGDHPRRKKCNIGLLTDALGWHRENLTVDLRANHTCGTSAAFRKDISSPCSIVGTFL